jgi:hypothetical protein
MPTNVYNISYPNQKTRICLPLIPLAYNVLMLAPLMLFVMLILFLMTSMVLKTKTLILGYQ